MKTYDCVCIGRSCIDYIALIKNYPQKDTKVQLLDYKICLGGQAANTSVVLSYLDIKTLLITIIGIDHNSKLVKNFLSQHKNLDVYFIIDKKIKTPCAFIWTETSTGKRTIVYEKIKTTDDSLYKPNILKKFVKQAKYIIFDHQSSKDIFEIKDYLKQNNIKLMMDAERNDGYMFRLLKYINYFVCSNELAKNLGISVKQLLKKFIYLGPEIVCCTLGKDGAVAVCKENPKKFYYSKPPKVKVVDTTGAGDVFHAGFMYGIIKNWQIEKILSFANKIAALSTKYIGGSSFLNFEET